MAEEEFERESHLRSVLKAFTWRILATTTTTIIAYLWTGEVGTALAIGGIEFFVKMFVYYAHERAWQLAPRGTVRKLVPHRDESDEGEAPVNGGTCSSK
jgi:uncharacterized membrane protein